MTVASFGFVLQLYPVYASMRKKDRSRFALSVNLALAMCFFVYLALAFTSIMFFGADQVQANIFDNFKSQTDIWSKYIMITFLLVLFCNIPFAFFAGKTALTDMVVIVKNYGVTAPVSDPMVQDVQGLNPSANESLLVQEEGQPTTQKQLYEHVHRYEMGDV
jgi:amino acid permease